MDFKSSSLLYSPGLAFFCSSSCEGAWKHRLYLVCSVWPIFSVLSDAVRASPRLWTWDRTQPRKSSGVKIRHGVASKGEMVRKEVLMPFKSNQTAFLRLFKDTVMMVTAVDLFCYTSVCLTPLKLNLAYNNWEHGVTHFTLSIQSVFWRILTCYISK